MTREKYESLPLATLKELAKARNMKGISTMKKSDLIDAMLSQDVADKQEAANTEAKEEIKEELKEKKETTDIEQLDSGKAANGILEVLPDGYGFIRCENYLPGENDVYVSPSQIRRFNLKTGDILTGNTRIKTQGEKFSALLYVSTINGIRPAEAAKRPNFEDLTPIFPNKRIQLEEATSSTAMRIVDLLSPIGKGQRGMIVSPPKAGKTTLLKVLGMLDKPEKGTVFYKGKDTKEIYGTELAKIRRTELSFIFQDFCLMDSLSIKDNILLPRILDEAEIEESKKICENLTKKFNINKLLNKKPYELSGGEKQRVAICRALINNPQIILADEPTGNLDSNSSEVVMRTLESINGEMGKTILLVTHDPMIASFCKRIIFLKDGQVIENLKRADNKEMFYQEILKRMKNL